MPLTLGPGGTETSVNSPAYNKLKELNGGNTRAEEELRILGVLAGLP